MSDLYLFVSDEISAQRMLEFLRRIDERLERAVQIRYVNASATDWRLPVLMTRREEYEGENAVMKYFIHNKRYLRTDPEQSKAA